MAEPAVTKNVGLGGYTWVVDGVVYEVRVPIRTVFRGPDWTEYHADPPQMEAVDRCACCGRSDLRERVARSIEQAVELGWLAPVRHLGGGPGV